MGLNLHRNKYYTKTLLLVSGLCWIWFVGLAVGFFAGENSTYKLLNGINLAVIPSLFWVVIMLVFVSGIFFGRVEYALQITFSFLIVYFSTIKLLLSPWFWDNSLGFILNEGSLYIFCLWIIFLNLLLLFSLFRAYKAGNNNFFRKNSVILWLLVFMLGIVYTAKKYEAFNSVFTHILNILLISIIASYIIQSLVFEILVFSRVRKNHFPLVINSIVPSAYEVVIAMVGLALLILVSWLTVLLIFIPYPRRKYFINRCMYIFARFYTKNFVSKITIEPQKPDLSVPAVIIGNHQSILDVLISMSLQPKIIVLTSKWVWNSPLFGPLVRMADYYPVTEGIDQIFSKLQSKFKQSYSIVVFPEGTRSASHEILRFKKGAFYLAQKLQADILPMVIHGTGYTYAKNNFWGLAQSIHVKFSDRIHSIPGNNELTLLSQSKELRRFFVTEYNSAVLKYEIPSYFKAYVFLSYVLKGFKIQRYIKKELKEKYIQEIHEIVPRTGIIHFFNGGFGTIPFSLYLAAKNRKLVVYENDDELINTARISYLVQKENIIFHSDVNIAMDSETIDCVIYTCSLENMDDFLRKDFFKKLIKKLTPKGNIVLLIRDYSLVLKKVQVKRIEKFEKDSLMEAELVNSGEDDYLLLNFKKVEDNIEY